MSEYKSYILSENEIDVWDEFVDKSPYGTIFHKYEWLKIAEEHAGMKFLPVAVNKGNTVVSLLPLFIKNKYGFRLLLSPPNSCAIPHLGPVFNIPATNRYVYEKTYINIIDAIIEFVEVKLGFDYIRIIHTPQIFDIRPYLWEKYNVNPNFTYILNLKNKNEEIYKKFYTSIRNNIKNAKKNRDILISHCMEHSYDTLSLVKERYSEQNRSFKVSENYIKNLMNSSFAQNIESVSLIHNGNLIAGTIDLMDRNHICSWLGTVNRKMNITGAGELLLWETLKEYRNKGYTTYDLVGANTRHLCDYKAKFGPDLVQYFVVYKASVKGKLALKLMNFYKKGSYD